MVEPVQNLPQLNAVKFQTKDGENITATKKDGVVTLVGDKNGVRQMPLEQFIQELPNIVQNLERSPEQDEVVFQGKKNVQNTVPDKYIHEYKVKAGNGKKAGVAVASAVLPGLGQAVNGDWGRAIAHFLGMLALCTVGKFSAAFGAAGSKLGILGFIGCLLAGIVNRTTSAVNAARNATKTVRVQVENS